VYVFVALGIHHAMRMSHIVISGLSGPTILYQLSHFIDHKMCLDFLYNLCLKHSLYEEMSEIWSNMYTGLHVQYPIFLSGFNETLTFSTDFRKVLKISNFMKIRKWKPSCCMQLDSSRLLWPARATTKISLAAPRHPLAVPVGWVLLGRIYCLNQLTTAPSPIGRKHHNESQGTLYYQQRRKYKKANKVN